MLPEQQKRSLHIWLLLCEFVKLRKELENEIDAQILAGVKHPEARDDLPLPQLSYVRGRFPIRLLRPPNETSCSMNAARL